MDISIELDELSNKFKTGYLNWKVSFKMDFLMYSFLRNVFSFAQVQMDLIHQICLGSGGLVLAYVIPLIICNYV